MKFWTAITKDGKSITESNTPWEKAKDNIASLQLHNNGQTISLPPNMEYVQGKTASADLNGKNVVIESRYIGLKLGNNIVIIRVNEKTGDVSVEISK
jgi:hypothetical protein